MGPFHDVKYHNVIKESIKKKNDSVIPIGHLLGPLGTALPIANFDSFCHFRTDNQIDLPPREFPEKRSHRHVGSGPDRLLQEHSSINRLRVQIT